MEELMKYSQGNPGALSFLMTLMNDENLANAVCILPKLNEMPSIRGTNLYVLWSDLCDKDVDKVVTLCQKCPPKILEDACSRQDYSGRELVAPYLST